MTSSQRRSTFRLPWLGDTPDEAGGEPTGQEEAATPPEPSAEAAPEAAAAAPEAAPEAVAAAPEAAPEAGAAGSPPPKQDEPPKELLHDLVAAMRGVADQARTSGLAELRQTLDSHVDRLRADSERRSVELRQRADADVAGIGEWAKAEAERIKAEAERRVAARRGQLDQQVAAEGKRAEQEIDAARARLNEFERELDAFFVQLAEIDDPSAFAAAVKRMPRAPQIGSAPPAEVTRAPVAEPPSAAADEQSAAEQPTPEAAPAAEPAAADDVAATTDQALAQRLAELDVSLAPEAATGDQAAASGEATTSTIIVQGLRSFGAITAFKQSLSGAAGIEAVSLSLGPTGEFVYRATHAKGFDIERAIVELEGGSAAVEREPDDTLRVTVERTR